MVSQYESRSPAGDRDQPRHCTGAGMAAAGAGHLTYDGRGLNIPPASHSALEALGCICVSSEQQMAMQSCSWYLARKCAWCCPRNYPRKLCENATQSGLFPRPAQLHIQHSQVHTAGAEQGRPCLGVLRLFGPLYIHIVNVVCPESRPWWYCRYGVMLWCVIMSWILRLSRGCSEPGHTHPHHHHPPPHLLSLLSSVPTIRCRVPQYWHWFDTVIFIYLIIY